MADLQESLKTRYDTACTSASAFQFLHALDAYMSFVDQEPVLKRITQVMLEDSAREAIISIRKSVVSSPSFRSLIRHIGREDESKYPIEEYDFLKEKVKEFSTIKSMPEADFDKARVSMVEETEDFKATSEISGKSLLLMAQLVCPKQLTALHTYIVKQLEWVAEHEVYSKYLDYDTLEGILYFQGNEIHINDKKTINNAQYLLSYLFSHAPFEKHFYDELEDEQVLLEQRPWKSYYDACLMVQKKVTAATGIDDFLDFNSGERLYVRLSPKYSLKLSDDQVS